MLNTSLKKFFVATLFANGLFLALPAAAEFITQQEAAEADAITVTLGTGRHAGTIIITGCKGCPLELSVDSNTRFYSKEKQIGVHEISAYSGKAGTAIYIKDSLRAVNIRW